MSLLLFTYTHTHTHRDANEHIYCPYQQAALVLNASRRFRYTLDLRKNEEQEKRRRMIRSHAQVIRVKGLSEMLKTDPDRGVPGDDNELSDRRIAFGSNTYPVKEGRSFLGFEEGWYDGGSITFAVLLVIFVTATSDFRQSLQFQNLNAEKRNIQIEITRGGRREKVSIYDVVVGDVIPLNIGDQVPADGLLIKGHSLAIDESSMTGESKIVHKDQKAPFLMSGCKVADGAGTMLVN
ncbi:putative P-type Ca(2+) transporter [Helianthus debilis subsp. tardiflorus]